METEGSIARTLAPGGRSVDGRGDGDARSVLVVFAGTGEADSTLTTRDRIENQYSVGKAEVREVVRDIVGDEEHVIIR
eukprot:3829652-Pleurochrysis_carterae.AAC.1